MHRFREASAIAKSLYWGKVDLQLVPSRLGRLPRCNVSVRDQLEGQIVGTWGELKKEGVDGRASAVESVWVSLLFLSAEATSRTVLRFGGAELSRVSRLCIVVTQPLAVFRTSAAATSHVPIPHKLAYRPDEWNITNHTS